MRGQEEDEEEEELEFATRSRKKMAFLDPAILCTPERSFATFSAFFGPGTAHVVKALQGETTRKHGTNHGREGAGGTTASFPE